MTQYAGVRRNLAASLVALAIPMAMALPVQAQLPEVQLTTAAADAVAPTDFNSITCNGPLIGDICIKTHCPGCGGLYGVVSAKTFSFNLLDANLPAGYRQCTVNDLNAFVVLSQSQVGDLGALGLDRDGTGAEFLFSPGGASCGSSLNATFDDNSSTSPNQCPATGGLVMRSSDGTLSSFNGKRLDATWSLYLNNNGPSSGSVNDFGFAADVSCVIHPGSGSGCTANSTTLCLNGGRFKVTATYQAPSSSAGTAHAVGLTGDTGYLWFFNSSNVEVVVKVLNGCGVNNRYWVFAGGLTNVRVVLTVEDTVAHVTHTNYINPQGTAYLAIQDTGAFATCL